MTSNFKNERAVKIVWGSLNKCICFRERVVPLGCGSEASPGWVSRKMITKLARNCQLSLARHWHECSWNLTLTLRELPVDSLISGAPDTLWLARLLFYFQIKYWNSILDITHWPEFIVPSRWLWALQSLNPRIMTRFVNQLSNRQMPWIQAMENTQKWLTAKLAVER